MDHAARKLWDFYDHKPGAGIIQEEFGFFTEEWGRRLAPYPDLDKLFSFDRRARQHLGFLGWCEAEFYPKFEESVVADGEDFELVRDFAGRTVRYFKGRRNGFMPEFVDHPVKDEATWEQVRQRLDPNSPGRYGEDYQRHMDYVLEQAKNGDVVVSNIVGAYMYLRSLIGPEDLLYMFYDNPALIHSCMEAWLELADGVTARQQELVHVDEIFFGEDICYNNGPLISPDMIREFLFPYYQQLITNVKRRRKSGSRELIVQVDTDGYCLPVIDLYREGIGMNYLSPFEVASGCDVVEIRKKYPDLLMRGGIDKRILAAGKDAIRAEVDRIMPFMKAEGGYIPCCDHGVPDEVSMENYMFYRQCMLEYAE